MGVFAREQAELAAGGIPDGVIASGALLPNADLPDLPDLLGAPVTAKIGAARHERFARSYEGSLITPGQSARSLMQHLASDAIGEIWNVNTSRPEE